MDIISLNLAKQGAKQYTDSKVSAISKGFNYLGSVAEIADLPTTATIGDLYTVGSLGTYVYDGSQWVANGGKGEPGPKGEKGDTGEGIPKGGAAGYVLKKKSDSDYDTEWAEESGVADYNDLINKPIIPSKTSELANDNEYLSISDKSFDTLPSFNNYLTLVNSYDKSVDFYTQCSTGVYNEDGTYTFTQNGDYPAIYAQIESGSMYDGDLKDHRIYARVKYRMNPDSTGTILNKTTFFMTKTGMTTTYGSATASTIDQIMSGEWLKDSSIVICPTAGGTTGTWARMYFYHAGQVDGFKFDVAWFTVMDLTEIYGAGNEPNKDTMDALLDANTVDGYFDGSIDILQSVNAYKVWTNDGEKVALKSVKEMLTEGGDVIGAKDIAVEDPSELFTENNVNTALIETKEQTNTHENKIGDLADAFCEEYTKYTTTTEFATENLIKIYDSEYKTSTFTGWVSYIGKIRNFNKITFKIAARGADTPITKVMVSVFKMNSNKFADRTSPEYKNWTEITHQLLTLDEPLTSTTYQEYSIVLDTPVENNTDNLIIFIRANNLVSQYCRNYKFTDLSTRDLDLDYTPGFWYVTGHIGDEFIDTAVDWHNVSYHTGSSQSTETAWMAVPLLLENISSRQALKMGENFNNTVFETLATEGIAYKEKVGVSTGAGSQPNMTINEADYTISDPSSTFTGEVQSIGRIAADFAIQGVRIPIKLRDNSVAAAQQDRATKLSVYLYTLDTLPENNVDWSTLKAVEQRYASITIDQGVDDGLKLYDVWFDEPFYNTEGKMVCLGTEVDHTWTKCYVRPLKYVADYCSNVDGNTYTTLRSYYAAGIYQDTSGMRKRLRWENGWEKDYMLAFEFITPRMKTYTGEVINSAISESISADIETIINNKIAEKIIPDYEVRLAKKYTAVVGDTLQLFYNGLIKGPNAENANLFIKCSKGRQYPRYWEFTPTISDVGTYSFTLNIRNMKGEIVSTGTSTIEVINPPTYDTSTTYNLLCFGDSLTSSGTWFGEGLRRIKGDNTVTHSGPDSLAIENLNLVSYGKKVTNIQGYKTYYEGYGGWTWGSFLAKDNSDSTINGIFVDTVSATGWDLDTVQHSEWTDQNGLYWKLEDIEDKRIKFDRGTGNTGMAKNITLPTQLVCSTLSLSLSSSDISAVTWESGNPFYDVTTQKIDFKAHAEGCENTGADIVACLLTWNGGGANDNLDTSGKINTHMTNATTLLRDIHNDLPNAKIICMGIQISSLTGGTGYNYGANGGYADMYGTAYYAFDYNKALEELVTNDEFGSYCYYVDTKGQFDTPNMMPYNSVPVNTRSTVTEKLGTNGVHPMTGGYYQIGDAFYRQLLKVLNDIK